MSVNPIAMPTLLAEGGKVNLWGGWSIVLPPSHHTRNDDGSWAAWGADWALDIQIIEVGAGPAGRIVDPVKMLGPDKPANAAGNGWIAFIQILTEQDSGKTVFRLAGSLAAPNTLMSCWVSFFTDEQRALAEQLINGIAHHAPRTA
jgi:hypothetical protein